MKKLATVAGIVLVVGALTGACNGKGSTSDQTASGKLEVEEAWARAVPESMTMSAAYMKIVNGTGEDDSLISASSDVSEVTELHEMAMVDETMKMRQVEKMDVPAGQTLELKPGGLHVMLIDLKGPLSEGQTVSLTLNFEKAGEIKIKAPVKKSEMKMEGHGDHKAHH